MNQNLPSIFISYSHKDEKEKNELLAHLGAIKHEMLIEIWSDDQIGVGQDWEEEINSKLSRADIAILLITANFLSSDFIINEEVPIILHRKINDGVMVFPIIAQHCAWKSVSWLRKMQLRPKNGAPVWRDSGIHADKELAKIVDEIAAGFSVSSTESKEHFKAIRRGLYIPNARCRKVWGRDRLVENTVYRLGDPNEVSIFSFNGGAGFGKTEVARNIAESVLSKNQFEDVLWIKARKTEFSSGKISGSSGSGLLLSKDEMVEELAIQLGFPKSKTLNHIKSSNYLIVLDNAEDADLVNILPMLSDITRFSRVLITTRLKVDAPYVGSVDIHGLDQTWSIKLLRDEATYKNINVLIDASERELIEIHQRTFGAPLALHFVVSRVLHDHSIESILLDLEQANEQVGVFYKFCFQTAWRRLSETAKNILRLLGHLSDKQISIEELSEPWGIHISEIQSVITELVKWHLIEVGIDPMGESKYDLHPWIRSSIRANLVDNWSPTEDDVRKVIDWKVKHFSQWKGYEKQ